MENEKSGINIGDIWYIVKKYWIMMLAIVVAAGAIGAAYSINRKQLYRASARIVIKADLGTDTKEKSDITYTNVYAPTILLVMSSDVVMARASDLMRESDPSASVSAGSFSAKLVEEDAWVAELAYTDGTAADARKKLSKIVEAFNEITEPNEDESYLFFQGRVEIQLLIARDREDQMPIIDSIGASPVYSATKTTVVAVAVGVIAAVAAAFVVYLISDRIASVDRVEEITGKKNIVNVSTIKGKSKDGHSLLDVNLEKLADTLVFLHGGENDKVYQIQSSIPHEGKTTVAANLAKSLGEIGQRVLVVECDFRKPNLHRAFGLKRQVGMTDYFKEEKSLAQVIKKTEYDNVSVITCGSIVDNPAIIFMSDKFGALIEEARKEYDFVLLDCPPVAGASDFISISQVVDSTVLVVGCDKVSSRQLKSTVVDLEKSGANVIGTVFNFTGRVGRNDYYYYSYKESKSESET